MSSKYAIDAKGITKSFGNLKVLKGIDVQVERGTILALLGPNGAGKTTTVRILATLLKADSGKIRIEGIDAVDNPSKVRSVIGLTGQNVGVDEYLSGRENMQMMGRLYHLSKSDTKRRTEELLKQFELEKAATRSVKTYSGGMKRRLDLALSLIATPPVIFMDEPTTGLDPRSRLSMWATIKELSAAGSTILLTTQQLEEADYLADKIVVIDGGKVIAKGTSDELKNKVGKERIELTFSDSNNFSLGKELLKRKSMQADEKRRALSIANDGGVKGVQKVLDNLETKKIKVEGISLHKPTLDDVFLELTGHQATIEQDEPVQKKKEEKMTTPARPLQKSGIYWAISDSLVLIKRSILHITKNMDQLLGVIFMPVMFFLLFRYVFGGAINTGSISYVNFLVAGILVQMAAFGATTTAIEITNDLQKGIMDRFRSLPMISSAVLIGHTTADLVRNTISSIILLIVAFIVGFRPDASFADWLAIFGILMLFTYAFSWLSAIVGLIAKTVEGVQWMTFVVVFPLTFASSAFVPASSMPPALRAFSENQPVTQVVESIRALMLGLPVGNSAWLAVTWCLGIIILAIPLTAFMFRRRFSR